MTRRGAQQAKRGNPRLAALRLTPRGYGLAVFALGLLAAGWRLRTSDLQGLGFGLLGLLAVSCLVALLRRRRLIRAVLRGEVQVRREAIPTRLRSGDQGQVVTTVLGSSSGVLPSRYASARWQFADAITDAMNPWGFPDDGHHLEPVQLVSDQTDRHELRYPVTAQAVGRWPLGPLTASAIDPFGLVRVRTQVGEASTVSVWPRTVDLPVAPLIPPLRGRYLVGGTSGAPDDAVLRGYVAGDDLRRIHWPTSARRGSLLVREEESSAERAVSVFVDPDLLSQVRDPRQATWALELAASIACSSLATDHATRIVSAGPARHISAHGEAAQLVLEQALAIPRLAAEEVADARLATIAALAQHTRGEALFAIVGDLDQSGITAMRALLAGGQMGYAWVLGDPATGKDTAAALRKGGWFAVTGNTATSLPDAWAALTNPARHTAAPAQHTRASQQHRRLSQHHRAQNPAPPLTGVPNRNPESIGVKQ